MNVKNINKIVDINLMIWFNIYVLTYLIILYYAEYKETSFCSIMTIYV